MSRLTCNSIETCRGNLFDYENPWNYPFTVAEISSALSKLCRFNGHTKKFYSVAEHSVLVCNLLPDEFKLEGLLHDAAEAYIGDIVTPLKNLLPDVRQLEDSVDKAIRHKYGLPGTLSPEVHEADMAVLSAEVETALRQFSYLGDYWAWLKPYREKGIPAALEIECLAPQAADVLFRLKYSELV